MVLVVVTDFYKCIKPFKIAFKIALSMSMPSSSI